MARGGEEVDHGLVDGPRLVVEPQQGQVGQEAQALQVVEEGGVQAEPLHAVNGRL